MTEIAAPQVRVRKPWYRPRNIVLAVVALVVLVIGREVYRAVTAEPGHAVNYGRKLVELVESHAPPVEGPATPNGYPLIARLCEISEEINAEMRARPMPEADPNVPGSAVAPYDFTIDFGPGADYNEKALEFMREANALARSRFEQAGTPALLDELSRRTRVVPPEQDGELIGWLLPELGYMRNQARLNAANMAIATRAGDAKAWNDAYRRMVGSARAETQQAFLISRLVGIAIISLANSELARGCIERRWDEPTLRQALDELDRQLALVPTMELCLEAERLSIMDTIQWTHTDDGHGDGRLIISSAQTVGALSAGGAVDLPDWLEWAEQYKIINVAGIAFAGKKATTRKANEYLDKVIEYALTPAPQRGGLTNPDVMVAALSPRFTLLRMMLPAVGKAIQSDDQFRSTTQATRILLALEIHRARHGSYPADLPALAPGIIPTVPLDPVNGRPFGFRLLTDDPAGRGYLLYSLGRDGIDDGGKADKDNLPTAMNNGRKAAGLDYIINWPREKPNRPDDQAGAPGGG